MAPIRFAKAIARGEPIDIYGQGRMRRDFTYVDDVVDAVMGLAVVVPEIGKPAGPEDTLSPIGSWRVVNIAGGKPVELLSFVDAIEAAMGQTAQKRMLAMQPGDVVDTAADTALLQALIGRRPETRVVDGVRSFVEWFREWHGLRRQKA